MCAKPIEVLSSMDNDQIEKITEVLVLGYRLGNAIGDDVLCEEKELKALIKARFNTTILGDGKKYPILNRNFLSAISGLRSWWDKRSSISNRYVECYKLNFISRYSFNLSENNKEELLLLKKIVPTSLNYEEDDGVDRSVLDIIGRIKNDSLKRGLYEEATTYTIQYGISPFIERDFFYLALILYPDLLSKMDLSAFSGWYSMLLIDIKNLGLKERHEEFLGLFTTVGDEVVLNEDPEVRSNVLCGGNEFNLENVVLEMLESNPNLEYLFRHGNYIVGDDSEEVKENSDEDFIKFKEEGTIKENKGEKEMENNKEIKEEIKEEEITTENNKGFFSKPWVKNTLIGVGVLLGGAVGAAAYNYIKDELQEDSLLEEIVLLPDGD